MAGFEPSAQEQQVIKAVFAKADTQDLGVVTGDEAVKVFAGSGLPPATLGEIWQLADTENNGFLTDAGLGIALRLIGWAQAGEKPKTELITRVGPLPTIKGIPIPGVSSNPGSPMPLARSPPPSLPARPALPPLTPDDRQKFLRMFFQSGPSQGLLNGDKARDLFLRSKLPTEKLSQIWHLADTHERGSLDSTDFIIGMFLIQSVMTGALQILPPSLPPGLYEQASGGASRPTVGSPLQAQFTGTSTGSRASPAFPQRAASPIRAQYTGQPPLQPQYTGQRGITPQYTGQSQFSQNTSVLRPQMTGQPFAMPQTFAPKWDVTAEEKAKSDSFFATLDPQGRGFIEGDVAVAFMVQSKLPEAILAQVWDLSDLNHDGKLTRDGFAVAMHLINGKLAGREVPNELPQSLIPPSYRGGAPAAPVPAQPTQSETIRDLWSLDEPVQTPTPPAPAPAPMSMPSAMTMPAPQHQRNLFDDDDDDEPASPAVTSPAPNGANKAAAATQSIEIANVQNQLASTQRALDTTTAQRQAASASADATAADLASLKEQLARATAARATEESHLAEIRTRKATQDAELSKVREELIRVESEASAIRIERGELETGLLRDKEELRGVQRKVGEVSEEVERAKGEVEKFKRETRQIKGMLAIARKQLGTVEGEKAKVEKEGEDVKKEGEEARQELEDVERQVAEGHAEPAIVAPVPTINGAATLSPQATGNLDRLSPAQVELPISRSETPADKAPQRAGSTNPFDRLRGASSSALPFSDVPANASPFGAGTPTSPFGGPTVASPTVTSPFGAPEGSSAFDAVFGESFAEPAKPTDDNTANLAPVPNDETPKPSVPAPQPSARSTIDDEDPFGMDAEEPEDKAKLAEPTQDKGKASEPTQDKGKANELEQTKEAETTQPPETNNAKAIEDPEVAAAASQFPALSLQNTPAPKSEDLPPLTELDQQDDSDSDDEPLDQQAKRKGLGEPESAPALADATTPTPAPAASPFPAPATSAPAFPASTSPFPAPTFPAPTFPAPTTSAPAPAPAASAFDDAFGVSSPSAPAPTGASAFDEAFKTIPSNNKDGASNSGFGFENSFDDNFDFSKATKEEGTASGFTATTQSTVSPTVPGAFSFDDAFGTGNTSMTSQGKPESVSAKGPSFDEAFGLSGSTTSKPDTGSAKPSFDAFGPSFSPGPRSAPPPEPVPVPTPIRAPGTASTMSRPSPPTSPTTTSYSGRASSPKNSKRSESPKAIPRMQLNPPPEPAQRHSKLSLHFPSFGRSKTTKDKSKGKKDKGAKEPIPDLPSPMPSTSSAAPSGTPAVDDDVEAVKTLCGMGFSRTQAVNALETHGYDVQKALNSLLGA